MRSVVFRFEDIAGFSVALGEARGSLALPDGATVFDGEWVLAIFEIGSRRRATAAAARAVRAAGDTHIAFERRDWDRLLQFVAARSEHMRAAERVDAQALSSANPIASERGPGGGTRDGSVRRIDAESPPSSVLESSRIPLGARVLLVDDDAGPREEIRRVLAEIGLSVDVVETADEARALLLEVAFDALVLDFQAQGIDPLDFVRSLRRDPRSAPIPVLVLSHRPSSRDFVDAFASGADDFLPTPFRAPELGARMFGLLRRARLTRPSPVVAGGASAPRSGGGGGGGTP